MVQGTLLLFMLVLAVFAFYRFLPLLLFISAVSSIVVIGTVPVPAYCTYIPHKYMMHGFGPSPPPLSGLFQWSIPLGGGGGVV
jgi:hypothetical protein